MPIVIGMANAIGWNAVDNDSPIEYEFLLWTLPDGYFVIDHVSEGRILLH